MCNKTPEGYLLSTGTLVKYENLDFSALTAEEFSELRSGTADLIEILNMKKSIYEIDTKLDTLINRLNQAIDTSDKAQRKMELDHSKCPVDEDHIHELFKSWYEDIIKAYWDPKHNYFQRFSERVFLDIKTFFKTTILTTGNIAKALTAIFVLLAAVGGLFYGLMKLAQ